jgi:hypothetical protein
LLERSGGKGWGEGRGEGLRDFSQFQLATLRVLPLKDFSDLERGDKIWRLSEN